mgnify:CR=1 FL=1
MTSVNRKIYKCEYTQLESRWDVDELCDDIGCKFEDIDQEETCVEGLHLVVVLKNGKKHFFRPNEKCAVDNTACCSLNLAEF